MLKLSVVLPVRTFTPAGLAMLRAVAAELRALPGDGIVVYPEGIAPPAFEEPLRGMAVDASASFAAAANAGARACDGEAVCIVGASKLPPTGWAGAMLAALLAPDVGLAGAGVVSPDGGQLEAGGYLRPARLTLEGFEVSPNTIAPVPRSGLPTLPCDVVSPACILTPRTLLLELGAFDPELTPELAVRDYALRVAESGRRVVCQAGVPVLAGNTIWPRPEPARARRRFADRWRERIVLRTNMNLRAGSIPAISREELYGRILLRRIAQMPDVTVFVHGGEPPDPDAFVAGLASTEIRPGRVLWAARGRAPAGVEPIADPLAAAREATESRGDHYVVFVRTDTRLVHNWLGMLVDALEFSYGTLAATVDDDAPAGAQPLAADARCTAVAPRFLPQHVRLDSALGLDDAVADWIARGVRMGRDVRLARSTGIVLGPEPADTGFAARWGAPSPAYRRGSLHALVDAAPARHETLASIVMLSWNAPQYTEIAVQSIRRSTAVPYEIIIIDNGSDEETRKRLAALQDVRIIYNEVNTGFAHGCNQGIAASRGSHVVLLNNDVIVTDRWLEPMIDVQRRHPAVGISAPRSNYVAGTQQVNDVPYRSLQLLHFFATDRAERVRGRWYQGNRVVGFCMCISREVVEEIGGLDTRYGLGNFEDDDFCLRARAAGYDIAVCEDSFIHHFGSISFRTNKLNYTDHLKKNANTFFKRWDIAPVTGTITYDPTAAILRGFDRAADYVPLPPAGAAVTAARPRA